MSHSFIPYKYGAAAAGLLSRGYIQGARRKYPANLYRKPATRKTTRRAGGQSRVGTNYQKPTATLYKRKNIPRKLKKRRYKNKMSFLSNTMRVLGQKSMVLNNVTDNTLTANTAITLGLHLYSGLNQDTYPPLETAQTADIANCFQAILNYTTQDPYGEKIMFKTAQMETILTNNADVPIQIKIYSVRCRKDTSSTITALYTRGFDSGQWAPTDTSFTKMSDTMTYATPFNQRMFGQYFIIDKCTTNILEPSQTVSWVKKDQKDRVIPYNKISTAEGSTDRSVCLRGLTAGYLITVQPLGTPTASTGDKLRVETNRSYTYGRIASNFDQSATYSNV